MLANLLNCKSGDECIRLLLNIAIILFIQMFLLKYFWNKALVPHVSVFRPITTLMDALMLSLGVSVVTALA